MSGLPRAWGGAVLRAKFRQAPEDFFVEELSGFEASGEGEHLLLTVEKRGQNTAFVAKQLASWACIGEVGIGYAGLKDRHAVTRQRFSVHLPKRIAPDVALLESESLRVLDARWHSRKLPRGALAGNRFVLVLRNVEGGRDEVEAKLQAMREGGLPNYFGEQRFGREGDNVDAARRMFAGARVKREQRSLYLSAARSEIFNAVLAARVVNHSWNAGADGEVWMLEGSHSVFGPETIDESHRKRAARLDIHPTGPLWGLGELRTTLAVRDLELGIANGYDDLCRGLADAGLKQERRALRLRIADLSHQWLADDGLQLEFSLPPGAYATGVLAELGDVTA